MPFAEFYFPPLLFSWELAVLRGVLSQGVNNYLQKPHKSYLHHLHPSMLWEPIYFKFWPSGIYALCTISGIFPSHLIFSTPWWRPLTSVWHCHNEILPRTFAKEISQTLKKELLDEKYICVCVCLCLWNFKRKYSSFKIQTQLHFLNC